MEFKAGTRECSDAEDDFMQAIGAGGCQAMRCRPSQHHMAAVVFELAG